MGDIVRVTLDVGLYDPTKTRYYQDGFHYLALEDPVPAGLVPINAALKTEGVAKERTARTATRTSAQADLVATLRRTSLNSVMMGSESSRTRADQEHTITRTWLVQWLKVTSGCGARGSRSCTTPMCSGGRPVRW